jgi:hypothetical protein
VQIYRKPQGEWNKLARKYRKGLLEVYLGSPIIELDGHQYVEVEYFYGYDQPILFPNVPIRGTLVLCDGTSVVQNAVVARKVMWSGLRLVSSISAGPLRQIEQFALFDEQESAAKVGLVGEIPFYKDQASVLSRYASSDALSSLVRACEQQSMALRQRSVEAAKKLRLMSFLAQRQCVQARHIEALDRFHLNAYEWDTRNTQMQLEIGKHADELHRQLVRHQEEWEQDQAVAEVCAKASGWWKLRATSSARVREELEQDGYADFEYAQRQVRLWKKLIDERMSLYRAPLDGGTAAEETTEVPKLADAELDEILADVPPLPDYPPWRVKPAKRVANHILFVMMMVALAFGIVVSVLHMAIEGFSFFTVSRILFFVFWMFFFAQRQKRR